MGAGGGFAEVAAIVERTDNGIPPCLRVEREFGRGIDVPDDEGPAEVGVTEILTAGGEMEIRLGEGAEFEHEREALPEGGGSRRVVEERWDGLLFAPDFQLPSRRLRVVADGLAAAAKEREREEEERVTGARTDPPRSVHGENLARSAATCQKPSFLNSASRPSWKVCTSAADGL